MITIYSYKIAEGTLECPSLQELPSIFESDNVDLWVDLEAPTPEESEILHTVFDFHELAIEDCTAVDIEEAKLDDYEDYLFIVFHSVSFNKNELAFDINELDLFFGKNYVVTYHKNPTPGIGQLKRHLEKGVDFMGQGTDEILHTIVDSLVDNYMLSFKELERTFYQIETEILSYPSKKTFNNLFKLKRELINLKRILAPEEEVTNSLGNSEHELIQEKNRIYFQDIHDHVSNIEGRLQSYIEMVTGTMYSYVSITSHRMNIIMQALTVVATIVLIPTLIASIYGMNFPNMPLQNNPHGFTIIMTLCFGLVLAFLWYFKKQDWF
ncbi:MAG TPA: magnesium/cobalt transporter CorA [Anaerolineae bacterium]|nr:magnesium/cobalt transporter CorA [Anaerolineae bacterium]